MISRTSAINADSGPSSSLKEARILVRSKLEELAPSLAELGLPAPTLRGQLLRPLLAYATVPSGHKAMLDSRFWNGCLAIQMVHEASLLHDDIIDEAAVRRDSPTGFASQGVGPALVLGDQLLTGAYEVAARVESADFLSVFIEAIRKTVSGEVAQGKLRGRVLSEDRYREIIHEKSGELFGCALALSSVLFGTLDVSEARRVGIRLGGLYQMLDDFLDYCPEADTGKPSFQDYRQRKWTWVLGHTAVDHFEHSTRSLSATLFRQTGSRSSPMRVALQGLDEETVRIGNLLERVVPGGGILTNVLSSWRLMAEQAVARCENAIEPSRQLERDGVDQVLVTQAGGLGRRNYFRRNSKTFHFAARLFPDDTFEQVAEVYAFCRFTDDLVDEAPESSPEEIERRLSAWQKLAREAYHGRRSGTRILDDPMFRMARNEVPFRYVDDLIRGVGMDLRPRTYQTLSELREYSYRVASVIGGWLTELFGVHDPWVLERAYAMGHAMQLTNILRDVGEDLNRDRIYLPGEHLAAYDIDPQSLRDMKDGTRSISPSYKALVEELIQVADDGYRTAFEGIPYLPQFFRRPVAAAAKMYQGIHDEIRKNDYDNLRLRAYTGRARKLCLLVNALWGLRRKRDDVVPTGEVRLGPSSVV